jgi:tetratricopeptide (TPR) repeat protein
VRCNLLAGKARMLTHLGQLRQSVETLEAAIEIARSPETMAEARAGGTVDPVRLRARLSLFIATLSMHQLETDRADRAVEDVFAVLDESHPELASAWALRSWALLHRNQIPEAAVAARHSLRLALAHGSFEERARAYSALTKPGLAGEIGPGIAVYANEAVRLAREHHHDRFLVEALISREVLRQICLQPHTAESLESGREAVELAQRMDSLPFEGAARIVYGAILVSAGLWDDAERELTSAPATSCALQVPAIMRRVTLARLHAARGRTDEAAAVLAEIDAETFPHGAVWLSAIMASHHLAAGDLEAARAALDSAIASQATLGCLACKALLGGVGAEVLAALGDVEGARELADQADRSGDGAFVVGRLAGAIGRTRAAIQAGEWDTAVAAAEAALPLAEEVGQPFDRARLLLALGTALARRNGPSDLDRAQSPLAESLAVFDRLGARPSVDLAVTELARLSSRPATLTT